MNLGLILGLFTLLTIIIILSTHKFSTKIFRTYIFNIIFGIIFLSYFLIFRYIPDLIYYIDNINALEPGTLYYSFKTSKVFFMDLCPLMAFLLPLSMIIDKSRSICKVIAPVALLGGLITIFGGIMFDDINSEIQVKGVSTWTYIFVGADSGNRLYFMMHYLLIVFSITNILNVKKYTRYSLYGSTLFYIMWMIYMQITIKSLNVIANATGLVKFDWFGGEYSGVTEILYLDFPFCVIFWYVWALVFNVVVVLIKNKLVKNNVWKWEKNIFWYSNYRWLNKYLLPIDLKINNIINSKFSWIYK